MSSFKRVWKGQVALLLLFCFVVCYATGYGFGYVNVWRDVLVGTFGSFALLLVLAMASPKISGVVLKVFIVSTVLYFSVGWLYGAPNFKIVGGALETDIGEAKEFFGSLPSYVYALNGAYLLFGAMVWRWVPSLFCHVRNLPKKWQRYLQAGTAIALIAPLLANYLTDASFQDDESAIPVNLVGFYVDLVSAPYIYLEKRQEVVEQASQPDTWEVVAVSPHYQNYVIVIGESARKDYWHAYGFGLENTPFVSGSKGLLIDGYIATADYTMASLPQTLSLPNQSNNNVISLAKRAGFLTAWFSNQGMLGFFSNEVSGYAQRSDEAFFTQRGDFQKSVGMSDKLLLPRIESFLAKHRTTAKPKLMVLHLMGSHQDFCERLDEGVQFWYKSEKLSCYVSTIKETDDFLRELVQILQKQGQSYSLVYFSDHGLKHTGKGTSELTLTHGGDVYQSFEVPLIKLSSDDTDQTIIKTQRSAFNFLRGFGQWTGIQTKQLDDGHDFWGEMPDVPSPTNNLDYVNRLKKDELE